MLDKNPRRRKPAAADTLKSCWLINSPAPLKITVLYIAVTNGGNIDAYAPQFARTYLEHPADFPHKLIVVCNGGTLTDRRKEFFKGTGCLFWERESNSGWDVGAYLEWAKRHAEPDEIILCLGESVHFHRRGWLQRIAQSRLEYGTGMYGLFSSHMVRAHLNTTGFAADARLLAKYPDVFVGDQRYLFEHGYECFWKRISAGGHTAALVTWDGIYFPGEWRDPANIMHRGNQGNLLAWCNHTERWATADPGTKALWSQQSDSVFKL